MDWDGGVGGVGLTLPFLAGWGEGFGGLRGQLGLEKKGEFMYRVGKGKDKMGVRSLWFDVWEWVEKSLGLKRRNRRNMQVATIKLWRGCSNDCRVQAQLLSRL
jgi:hypothetical protein